VAQLNDSLGAIRKLDFTKKELKAIDRQAVDLGIDLWERSRLAG
jgi:L-glyceraldehyde 3-phosphate reductase